MKVELSRAKQKRNTLALVALPTFEGNDPSKDTIACSSPIHTLWTVDVRLMAVFMSILK